uniref:Uncharacterized protein n=1 Tax=Oryza sativa subsp. japonica TaxID=39947 RepID=Q7EZ89_ORYSJ|nr:hypothetical protein [Oryza sativa Japonica Group]
MEQSPHRRQRLSPLGPRPTQEQPPPPLPAPPHSDTKVTSSPAITDELQCVEIHGYAVPCGALGVLHQWQRHGCREDVAASHRPTPWRKRGENEKRNREEENVTLTCI